MRRMARRRGSPAFVGGDSLDLLHSGFSGALMSSRSAEYVADASRRVEKVYGVLARVYDGFFDWALGPGALRRRS